MPTNKLSDHQCRAAKPGPKDRKLFDGNGMYLFITAKGAKVWRMAYRDATGAQQTKTFGPYPTLSLADAREEREKFKRLLLKGENPKAPKKATTTFWEDAKSYWMGRQDVSNDYRDNALRGLELHLVPALGTKPTAAIDRALLLEQLNRMDAAGRYVFVRKVRLWASQVFDWAIEQGYATINPAELINPKKAFGRRKVKNHASLELNEVHEFMHRLSFEQDINSVLACRLMAYTWVRTNELRMMRWSEIDGDVWLIPEDRMKREKDHIIPLSRQALEILEKMRARQRGSEYVFAAEHRLDRTISENTVLALIARMGYKGEMTGHGWRSIASTWANEEGYDADAIERQLAHTPEDKVRSAYNRAAYMKLRRPMLQAWADWLDKPYPSVAEGGELPA